MTTTFTTFVAPAVLGAVLLSSASNADAATAATSQEFTWEHKVFAASVAASSYCRIENGSFTEEQAQQVLKVALPQRSLDWVLLTDQGHDAVLAIYPHIDDTCAGIKDQDAFGEAIAPYVF